MTVWRKLDYLGALLPAHSNEVLTSRPGIFLLGNVNFIPSFYYGFSCDPHLRDLYIGLMTLSCASASPPHSIPQPEQIANEYRSGDLRRDPLLRSRQSPTAVAGLGSAFWVGGMAFLPFAHAVWRYGVSSSPLRFLERIFADEHAAHAGFRRDGIRVARCRARVLPLRLDHLVRSPSSPAFLTNLSRSAEGFPERFSPGTFDLIVRSPLLRSPHQETEARKQGSSHQIFHCLSMLAVGCQFAAASEGFRYRHGERGGVCA